LDPEINPENNNEDNISVTSSNSDKSDNIIGDNILDGDDAVLQNQNHLDKEMDTRYGARVSTHNLCPRKARDYGHLHTTLEHTAMTQY
jgi:hypothetical protein